MCGICGIYNFQNDEEVDSELIHKMTSSMVHRGPDDEGYYLNANIGFGHRRLSVIDVVGGHQPISNEDGTIWIVVNGEIYNYLELRKNLIFKGHNFKTLSDTEVIVHLYEEMGADCLKELNGIFVFSLWDDRREKLFLARDHFGVKPLYYYNDSKRFVFASEIKSILQERTIPRELDVEALDYFLTYRFVPSPRTMLKGIKKLAPGHRLICNENGIHIDRYWNPIPTIVNCKDEDYFIEGLQDRLISAVKRQMISDVPLGALLSGGIDSSTIVAIMSELATEPVKTFAVGFKDGEGINEIYRAREVANIFGTEHHEVIVSHNNYAEFLPTSIWYLEEPIGTSSAVAMYYVCELARDYVKVVLTGQGADELFAGYYKYIGEKYSRFYRAIPLFIRSHLFESLIKTLPRHERMKRAIKSLGAIENVNRFVKIYSVFSEKMKSQLYQNSIRAILNGVDSSKAVAYWQAGIEHLDSLSQILYIDARFSLADDLLMYGDKMSMATSIEARVPFLDVELVEFVENIPSLLKLKGLNGKHIYKKAVSRWLPKNVIQKKKINFATPIDKWFRRELKDLAKEILLDNSSMCKSYFNRVFIENILEKHKQGKEDYHRQLFSLLSLEIWYRQFIDRCRAL